MRTILNRERSLRSLLLLALCLPVLFFMLPACNNSGTATGPKEVKIACNLPLTGDVAVYGISVRDGILFAQDDLAKEHQRDSLHLTFDFQDNQSNNTQAVSILTRQLSSNPQIYISGLDHQTSAIISQIANTGIPHFTYSWEPFICKKGPDTYRTGINLEQESEYYVSFILHHHPSRLAIVHINDPGSFVQFDSLVIPRVKAGGVSNILYEAFDYQASDFKTLAAKLKAFKPDLIVAAGYDSHLVPLIKDFRAYGLVGADNMMCSVDLLDASPNLTPELLEGLRFTCPEFVSKQTPELQDWKARFEKKFGRKAKYGDAYAYDMTHLIYQAAMKSGDLKPASLSAQIRATDMQGITGHLSFNSNRDLSLNLHVSYFHNGAIYAESY